MLLTISKNCGCQAICKEYLMLIVLTTVFKAYEAKSGSLTCWRSWGQDSIVGITFRNKALSTTETFTVLHSVYLTKVWLKIIRSSSLAEEAVP